MFFSCVVMVINLTVLVVGLCYGRLIVFIDEGARPPTLLNIAIMAESGSTSALDAMAQAHNDLLIAKGFTELIITDHFDEE